MDTSADFALALQLQQEFYKDTDVVLSDVVSSVSGKPRSESDTSTKTRGNGSSLCDETWELVDPNPDAWALFIEFNKKFFWGKLTGVELRWSTRMTLCAGLCEYEGRGGLCCIKLSEPLLKLRPRKDLVETLLHEMIHAYLFVTSNDKDRQSHGPEFLKHMHRLNAETGAKISVYHTFHDEVDLYRTHWWRCNGPCRDRRPYFGYVKRATNRAPSKFDSWFSDHQRTCGGVYTKIKEPEGYGAKKTAPSDKGEKTKPLNTIDKWCNNGKKDTSGLANKAITQPKTVPAATCSKPHDVDGFSFDSMSDDDLVSAVDEVEAKSDNKSKSNIDKMFHENIGEFPGQGYVLGARSIEAAAGGPIVRRIPGIGVISGRAMSAPGRDHADIQRGPPVCVENKAGSSTTSPRTNKTDIHNKVAIRGASIARDLSDSEEDFDRLLASHRSRILNGTRLTKKKKVSASEFTSRVFGSVTNKQGSIVNVANFKSVSNPKAKRQTFSDKDPLPQVRSRVPSIADDDEAVSEMRPTKRLRVDTVPDIVSNGATGNNSRSVSAGSNPAAAAVVLIEEEGSPSHFNISGENNNLSSVDHLSTSATQRTIPLDTHVNDQYALPNVLESDNDTLVKCPICYIQIEAMLINIHLDDCLAY